MLVSKILVRPGALLLRRELASSAHIQLPDHLKEILHNNKILPHVRQRIAKRPNEWSPWVPPQGEIVPFTAPVTIESEVYDLNTGKKESIGSIALNTSVFGQPYRNDILHTVVEWQRAKRRQGTRLVKQRHQLDYSGIKMRPQKGTGKARMGQAGAPHHRGGAKVFGKQPRDYSYHLPIKIRRMGLTVALSTKLAEGNLFVIEKAAFRNNSTGDLLEALEPFDMKSCLLIHGQEEEDANLFWAGRTINWLNFLPTSGANVLDIIRHHTVFVSRAALDELYNRVERPARIEYAIPEADPNHPDHATWQRPVVRKSTHLVDNKMT